MSKCNISYSNPELCGGWTTLYSVLLVTGEAVVLCANCLGRWNTFGTQVLMWERISVMEPEDFK